MKSGILPEVKLPYVCERDIDMLLLGEFSASPAFLDWFAKRIGISAPVQLISAGCSITTHTGESDLELYLKEGFKVYGVLVENKLDAILQTQQAERYLERARKYIIDKKCSECRTVIIAPREYFHDEEQTRGFGYRIDIEAILDWFEQSDSHRDRIPYMTTLLNTAIEKGCVGWKLVPDRTITEFWRQYWELASLQAQELRMAKPMEKPAASTFIYFRPLGLPINSQLVHKLEFGYVDLQFGGMGDRTAVLEHRYSGRLEKGMRIDRAFKSGVVRIRVPEIDVTKPFSESKSSVQKALKEALRLLKWFKRTEAK